MAEGKPISNLVNLGAWLTGILVSLAVGFGMIDGVLTVWKIPSVITVIAGWVVVVLTIASVILAIANRF
tara:strand:- start:49 stop:255 length:207 start_codon:yes stop_codon:yes gene_type:complete